jgi:hypothetical protein
MEDFLYRVFMISYLRDFLSTFYKPEEEYGQGNGLD